METWQQNIKDRLSAGGSSSTFLEGWQLRLKSNLKKLSDYEKEKRKREKFYENLSKIEEETKRLQADAEKAKRNVAFLETISGIPKDIALMLRDTGAGIADIATRVPGPLKGVKETADVAGSLIYGKGSARDRFKQGMEESKTGELYFEKARGKKIETKSGNLAQQISGLAQDPEARAFLARTMEAPLYIYSAGTAGVNASRNMLMRLLIRTGRSLPEATIQTGIQAIEEGGTKNAGTNLIANSLLMSTFSNIGGEFKLGKINKEVQNLIPEIEGRIGRKLETREIIDIRDGLAAGVKEKELLENIQKANELPSSEVEKAILKNVVEKTDDINVHIGNKDGEVMLIRPAKQKPKPPKKGGSSSKKTESPIIKRINKNLDEASKLDDTLETTTRKNQLASVEKEILDNPQKVYNDAVFGGAKSDTLKTSKLALLLENAKAKNDIESIAEIGEALARHGRMSGQEVEMIKATIGEGTTNRTLVEFAKSKLGMIESRFSKLVDKKSDDVSRKIVKTVKEKSNQMLKKDMEAKVSSAKSLIKSLTC